MTDQLHEPATPMEQAPYFRVPIPSVDLTDMPDDMTPRQLSESIIRKAFQALNHAPTREERAAHACMFFAWGFCLFATHGRHMLTMPGQRAEFHGVRVGA